MNIKIKYFVLLTALIFCNKNLISQSDFYAVDTIREIKIFFEQNNWDELLDSLYIQGEHNRLQGNLTIDGINYPDVGVRYKGFSSFSTTRAKNPFNISLDYVHGNQHHEGFSKLKLSNVIQDPSFIREVLSYEIARKYLPSSEANFANVYVNDTLVGLYSNVESVNKDFLEKHYENRYNTFIKCNPESLDLNGENSNLSNSPGVDIANYYPFYNLKSDYNYGWNELVEFIDTLNSSSEVETLLNVDRALWMHAFNYSLINFDSYVGYAQNFYIYKDNSGQFNPILWDLNMSFASYRLTDASSFWDGFSIEEAKTMDPLLHLNSVSVFTRPLMRNLFENDMYRRMYIAHIRTIIEENFSNQDYLSRGLSLQNKIDASVVNDTNKFYSYTDFTNNLTTTVSDLVDYPGITELMDARSTYLEGYEGFQGSPTITTIETYPSNVTSGDNLWVTSTISDPSANVYLAYRFSTNEKFNVVLMSDDGTQNDGIAGDGIFGAMIDNISNNIDYYLYAENDLAGRFSPERAAYEYYNLKSPISSGDLVINELMANNDFTVSDQNLEYEDWIELYNTTNYPISTNGLFLSDDLDSLDKWALPDFIIEGNSYAVIWADEDLSQSGHHANFKLNEDGEFLSLSNTDGIILDSISFGNQYNVSSYGRLPNGTGNFQELIPTFNAINEASSLAILNDDIFIYPNPAKDYFNIKINADYGIEYQMISVDGKIVIDDSANKGTGLISIQTSNFQDGIYFLSFKYNNQELTKKVIISNL
mgnify:CR=1 FL=1